MAFVAFITFHLNNKIALIPGQVRCKLLRKLALKHFNNAVKAVRDSHFFSVCSLYKSPHKKNQIQGLNNLKVLGGVSSAHLACHLKLRDVCGP